MVVLLLLVVVAVELLTPPSDWMPMQGGAAAPLQPVGARLCGATVVTELK